VVSSPDFGAKQMVSREGAGYAEWSSTGHELFFWQLPGFTSGVEQQSVRMMMSRRAGTTGPAWQTPVSLFELSIADTMFAPARDGRSLYVNKANPNSPAREIFVVVNWLQDVLSRSGGPHP